MHTYLKYGEDSYGIGLWLINLDGHHSFSRMFTVPTLGQAFNAVNMLNGGHRTPAAALHITEAS